MSYAGVESPAPEHEHRHCGDPDPHETHRTGTYWKPVICTGQVDVAALARVEALADEWEELRHVSHDEIGCQLRAALHPDREEP